jgi:hypothetical protein
LRELFVVEVELGSLLLEGAGAETKSPSDKFLLFKTNFIGGGNGGSP